MPTEAVRIPPEKAQLLYDLGCAFAEQLELDELVGSITRRCRDAFTAEGTAVLLLDEGTQQLYFPYVAEEDPVVAQRLLSIRFPAGQGIAGGVLTAGKGQIVNDVASDPRFYTGVDEHTGIKTRAIMTAPLISQRGRIGVIQVINPSAGEFGNDDLMFLEALAGSIGVAIENARMYGELKTREENLRVQVGALRRDMARQDNFQEIIGSSEAMAEVFHYMESAAASPIAVLIEGETGTGKELVARGIHRASDRGGAPFLAVNCAALPAELLESELFGHRKGAFTGAIADRVGIFEAASGGTIFLDEVGELPIGMQAKLLRVLQNGELTPLGTTQVRKVDIRVISATNRDLKAAVADHSFREDLYYRLATFPLAVPALRERAEDIPLLADHFLTGAVERHKKHVRGIESAAFDAMMQYEWPGNVRQLENEIERGVALTLDGAAIEQRVLSKDVLGELGGDPAPLLGGDSAAQVEDAAGEAGDTKRALAPLKRARSAFEARYIAESLRRHDGNVSHTAEALGLSRVMLQKKMKEYRLR
jgi:Nif-specific regulatory protein